MCESVQPTDQSTRLPPDPVSLAVQRIAMALRTELPAGDVADLRRLRPDDPACPAFWKMLAAYVAPYVHFPANDPERQVYEIRWSVVLGAMAHLNGLLGGPPLGRALAACEYAELRFVKLLRARPPALFHEVAVAARYLAAKGQAVDPVGLSRLVLTLRSDRCEALRRRIARDYYANSSKHEKES